MLSFRQLSCWRDADVLLAMCYLAQLEHGKKLAAANLLHNYIENQIWNM